MEMDVYADLFFLINFSMDYLCLYLSVGLLHLRKSRWRMMLASALGGVYSVIALFVSAQPWLSLGLDLSVCFFMCALCAAGKGVRVERLLLLCGTYFGSSALMGGGMTALYNLLGRANLPLEQVQSDGISAWMFLGLASAAALIAAFGGSTRQETMRNIFSVNLYAVAIALLLVAFNIQLPTILAKVCHTMGNAAVPLVLIGIGAAIYNSAGKLTHHLFDIFYLSVVRLILLPIAIIMMMKLLPLKEDIFRVLAVVSLMPVSSSSVLVARRYGGDIDLASQAIIITTLLSIVTAPLMLKILL